MSRMDSLFTLCESIRLFLLGSGKNKGTIYQGRAGGPFSSEELKTKIKTVWKDCATGLKTLQKAIKQFVPTISFIIF